MSAGVVAELHQVMDVLRSTRFLWASEDELQRGVAAAFTDAGLVFVREARLDSHSRPDFLVGRVAVEVKVAGAEGAVYRQLIRYARSDQVDAVVLVTACARHGKWSELVGVGTKPVLMHRVGSTL